MKKVKIFFVIFHFATALAWDIPRAIFTLILILIFGKPILNAIRRAMQRGNFEINPERALEQTAA